MQIDKRDLKAFKAYVKNIDIDKLSKLAADWAYDNTIHSYGYSFKQYLELEYLKHLETLEGYIPYVRA